MVKTHGKRCSTRPSRRRYEASLLTASSHVDLDLYARLKEKANLSVADVWKGGSSVSEAHHTGCMGGLGESYAIACDNLRWQLEKGDVPSGREHENIVTGIG